MTTASLDAMGFSWTVRLRQQTARKSFEQQTADLRVYKEKNGDVNVKGTGEKLLNKFCKNIRYARKHPEKYNRLINVERIASLDALGFEWNMRIDRKSFAQRIEDLRAYKEKHGHVNVKEREDKSLNRFLLLS